MALVRIPASSANMGPGFDCLGVALNLYNHVEINHSDKPLQITLSGKYQDGIPCDETNLVYQAARRLWQEVNFNPAGIQMHLTNNIPPSRGLGSSSAAILGGLVGGNLIAGSPLSREDILDLASTMEGHPDNVAAALYGGANLAIIQPSGKCLRQNLGSLDGLKAVTAIPEMHLSTNVARKLLPAKVDMSDAVWNLSRTALLVSALLTGEYALLKTAMEDRLHEQYRASAIPGMNQALTEARQAGALGSVLSGAGPTLISFVDETADEVAIADAMAKAFNSAGVACEIHYLQADTDGAVELPEDQAEQKSHGGLEAC